MRLLGIDYGSKRIGVALSDSTNTFALPHSVVSNTLTALEEIVKICTDNDVEKIIVGESNDFSGKPNPIMEDIEDFVHDLHTLANKEVIFHPEFLTSAEAEQVQGKTDMLDASAAAIILQSYIDSNPNDKDQMSNK